MKPFSLIIVAGILAATWIEAADVAPGPVNLVRDRVLYAVAYSHLDTQWRWTHPQTIEEFIPRTVNDNLALTGACPHYVVNFSGANRYRLMKEYHPALFAKVKEAVKAGRWFPCGSSWEECQADLVSAESVIRQVLYGNRWFRRELGQDSVEFMLPGGVSFPASLPSLLAHGGLKGFSTQKLTGGAALDVPFAVGTWEGPDGQFVVAVLKPGDYTGAVTEDLAQSQKWLRRIEENGQKSGPFCDYMYYGAGDKGGAPKEASVQWIEKSVGSRGPVKVVSATADRMFRDISPSQAAALPRYKGEILLARPSVAALAAQACLKQWNRRNECLADAAEKASVAALWLGGADYPERRLTEAWQLVLAAQAHEVLSGAAVPKAYEYAWNDEALAMNQFLAVIRDGVGVVARGLDTKGDGIPLVVFNPLSVDREDVVEAELSLPDAVAVRVLGPDGAEVPAQVLAREGGQLRFLFNARVPSVGFAVFEVRPIEGAAVSNDTLKVGERMLENGRYRVTIDEQGDIAGIFDKEGARELLSASARLAFLSENLSEAPNGTAAWLNRMNRPSEFVAGPARIRVTETGPVRVAVEITRAAQGSVFVQTIRLAAGGAGNRVEILHEIDWKSRACTLKAVFPLSVSNRVATFSADACATERENNSLRKWESPSRSWMDLTAADGVYGVAVLDDGKYGADKPSDTTLRLTLLHTPGIKGGFSDQWTQDHGRHRFTAALVGHGGDWRRGNVPWEAARLNQPLQVFPAGKHDGRLGKSFSMARVMPAGCPVAVRAMKKAEDSDEIILRIQEMEGRIVRDAQVSLPVPFVAAREVNGQEQEIGRAMVSNGCLSVSLGPHGVRAFAVKTGRASMTLARAQSVPLAVPFDLDGVSADADMKDGNFDGAGGTLAAEELPRSLVCGDVLFKLGPTADGQKNAVVCRGQTVTLPEGRFPRVYLLAASIGGDVKAVFKAGGKAAELTIRRWDGLIGQGDNRVWSREKTPEVTKIEPGYFHPEEVAWFCSHRHAETGRNVVYDYSCLFKLRLDLPEGATEVVLPDNDKVRIMAMTAVMDENGQAASGGETR